MTPRDELDRRELARQQQREAGQRTTRILGSFLGAGVFGFAGLQYPLAWVLAAAFVVVGLMAVRRG